MYGYNKIKNEEVGLDVTDVKTQAIGRPNLVRRTDRFDKGQYIRLDEVVPWGP